MHDVGQPRVSPYGTWTSSISAADIAHAGLNLCYPMAARGQVWWQETRPDEGGRTTVMHLAADGVPRSLLPPPWSARTRVHEYGGRSYVPVPHADGYGVVFCEYSDQRLYRLDPGAREPVALTCDPQEATALRYADLVLPADDSRVICVQERHSSPETGGEPGGAIVRAIVAIPLDGTAVDDPDAAEVLVTGSDFFAAPRPSPDGAHLAWVCWDHPRMPWDGAELKVAELRQGSGTGPPRTLLGGPQESVLAPSWKDNRNVYVISDRSGWWNLYEVDLDNGAARPLHTAEEEFAGPPWLLGGQPYAVLDDGRLAVLHGVGQAMLSILEPRTGHLSDVRTGFTDWSEGLWPDGGRLVAVASGPATPPAVVRVDVGADEVEVLRREIEPPDAEYLPVPEAEVLRGRSGRDVHVHIYRPRNPRYVAPEGERPPYLVFVHGGPTGHMPPALDLQHAYFTSRGIGVVEVNYGGSTGYGRRYRERLRSAWGVVDVEDCAAAAMALAQRGEADGRRLAIRGASAGGWTALAAATRTDVFAAATSYFGVSDPLRLVSETHDFESHYLDGLIGSLPAARATYIERAPLNHVQDLHCPTLLLQGLEDPVVTPAQSLRFVEALREAGIRHAYLAFKGESHGFRRARTQQACLEAELSFYGQVFDFVPSGVPVLELS